MKRIEKVSGFPFPVIYFKAYTNEITTDGLMFVDTFALHYKELYESSDIYITPYNLKEEYEKNPYIGIDRYREFIKILKCKYKIDVENRFYYCDKEYDGYFARENKTGLHILGRSR